MASDNNSLNGNTPDQDNTCERSHQHNGLDRSGSTNGWYSTTNERGPDDESQENSREKYQGETNYTTGKKDDVEDRLSKKKAKASQLYRELSLRVHRAQIAKEKDLRRVESEPKSFENGYNSNNGDIIRNYTHTSFNCQEESDKKPTFIVSITCLADDRIVVADFTNRKLKLFSSDFVFKISLGTPELFAVRHVSDSELVVVHSSSLRFYSTENDQIVRLKKCIKVQRGNGVAFDNNIYAVVCDVTRECCIKLFSDESRLLGTIDINKVFECQVEICPKIEMDSKSCHIFLTIYNTSTVVCIDFDGNRIWETSMKSLSGGILTVNNELLVACHQRSVIQALSKEGSNIRTMFNSADGLCRPFRVAYQSVSRNILVVEAKDKENVATVHILPLK